MQNEIYNSYVQKTENEKALNKMNEKINFAKEEAEKQKLYFETFDSDL